MESNVATYLFSRSVQNTLVEDESTTVTCLTGPSSVSLVRKIYEIIWNNFHKQKGKKQNHMLPTTLGIGLFSEGELGW